MGIEDITKILDYFTEYRRTEKYKKYYHNGEDFDITIYYDNSVFQTINERERIGIELDTLDSLKIRFKSFTGEDLL